MEWVVGLVSVEERHPGEVALALGFDTDLDHIVLEQDAVIFAIKPVAIKIRDAYKSSLFSRMIILTFSDCPLERRLIHRSCCWT